MDDSQLLEPVGDVSGIAVEEKRRRPVRFPGSGQVPAVKLDPVLGSKGHLFILEVDLRRGSRQLGVGKEEQLVLEEKDQSQHQEAAAGNGNQNVHLQQNGQATQ